MFLSPKGLDVNVFLPKEKIKPWSITNGVVSKSLIDLDDSSSHST